MQSGHAFPIISRSAAENERLGAAYSNFRRIMTNLRNQNWNQNLILTKKQIDKLTITSRFVSPKQTRLTRSQTNSTAGGSWSRQCLGSDNEACVICQEKFRSNDKIRRLPCMHLFHFKCINIWLKSSIACPICRMSIQVDYDKLKTDLESRRTVEE